MNKFNDTREIDVLRPLITSHFRRQQQKQRTDPLATTGQDIFTDLANQRHIRFQMFAKLGFNLFHVTAQQRQRFIHPGSPSLALSASETSVIL